MAVRRKSYRRRKSHRYLHKTRGEGGKFTADLPFSSSSLSFPSGSVVSKMRTRAGVGEAEAEGGTTSKKRKERSVTSSSSTCSSEEGPSSNDQDPTPLALFPAGSISAPTLSALPSLPSLLFFFFFPDQMLLAFRSEGESSMITTQLILMTIKHYPLLSLTPLLLLFPLHSPPLPLAMLSSRQQEEEERQQQVSRPL
jgi:hypothetical protein